jgi:hypothetical protein
LPATPLETGIDETMRRFAELRASGRLDTSDIDAEIAAMRERTA